MKSILFVIDYQQDFVSGSLGFPQALSLEDCIAEKIKKYRSEGATVAFTFDTHHEDYLSTQEGKNLPVAHCLKGTKGWQLYGKIAKLRNESDPCFEKVTFASMALANYLQEEQYDRIEFVGVVSNICVLSNAVLAKAALPEAEILVDATCTASNDEVLHQAALNVMEGLQIKVVNR